VTPPSNQVSSLLQKGEKSFKNNHFQEAEQIFAEAISMDEQNVAAWHKLGQTWRRMGKKHEASEALTMAHQLSPEDSHILFDLGASLIETGQDLSGLSYLEKSYKLAPSKDLAILLGDAYFNLKDYKSSSFYYLSAYKDHKSDQSLQYKLAVTLHRNGELDQAIGMMVRLVNQNPKNKTYQDVLTDFYRRFSNHVYNEDAQKAIETCLDQTHLKFNNLRAAWSSLFIINPKLDKLRTFARHTGGDDTRTVHLKEIEKDLGSSFLCNGLIKLTASGIALEYMFSNLRHYFLMHWEEAPNWGRPILQFLTALAVQCWHTDFVYYVDEDEKKTLATLREHLKTVLFSEEARKPDDTHAMWLALYCCYEPLYEFYTTEEKLPLSKSAMYVLAPLIEHQLTNPKHEASLIPSIPGFTTIEDDTSKAVQKMYETRPYPRWASSSVSAPQAALQNLSSGLEILIAGCGTGQEAAFCANMAQSAHITAIDLSRTSIAYGIRQTQEMGFLPRITFMHGDLAEVGKIGKTYDFITSSGVLHHMKEPEKGLAAITACLKENGRMSLSLYSRIARDYMLNPASEYIKQKGYSSSLDDIRQFRRDLFSMTAENPILRCTMASDFYNLAECNDMLFHVQEHRYTLKEFIAMADRHGLEPVHIMLPNDRQRLFLEQHPASSVLDLDAMTEFEEKNPKTFLEMYKVYFRKKGQTEPNPLDPLIYLEAI
jgi:2-polyprenyl-3-methyl-5-hydroxy-6-metoxy-1,4-benzoquinol methylase/Flp pilus assembly protein TadD